MAGFQLAPVDLTGTWSRDSRILPPNLGRFQAKCVQSRTDRLSNEGLLSVGDKKSKSS